MVLRLTGEHIWAERPPTGRACHSLCSIILPLPVARWAGEPCTVDLSVLNSQGGSLHQPTLHQPQVKYLFQIHHFLESLIAGYQELDWP